MEHAHDVLGEDLHEAQWHLVDDVVFELSKDWSQWHGEQHVLQSFAYPPSLRFEEATSQFFHSPIVL
jgi:hypothetical protein